MRRRKFPREYDSLAVFNLEVARGIVHTPEWTKRMARLQHLFQHWIDVQHGHAPGDSLPPPYPESLR